MIRNSRTPTILLVGMIVVIIIITYNYWNLLDRNSQLRDRLIASEEKLSDLNEKKASLEKQESSAQDKLKSLSDNLDQSKQALQKKDSEIDELDTRLKNREQDNQKLALELADLKDKLVTCQKETSKMSGLQENLDRKMNEINELKLNISGVEDKLHKSVNIHDNQVNEFKTLLVNLVKTNFDSNVSNKLISLLNYSQPASTLLNLEKRELMLNESKLNDNRINKTLSRIVTSSDDICLLPKEIGKCDNSSERYYYDSKNNQCLVFVYSGCDGNLNNFETLNHCQSKCLRKNFEETTTERANFDETTQN